MTPNKPWDDKKEMITTALESGISYVLDLDDYDKIQKLGNVKIVRGEKINEMENFLRGKIQSSFSDLVQKSTDKVEVIVSFLAMLEMIKQRLVEVEQNNLFEDIKLSLKNN